MECVVDVVYPLDLLVVGASHHHSKTSATDPKRIRVLVLALGDSVVDLLAHRDRTLYLGLGMGMECVVNVVYPLDLVVVGLLMGLVRLGREVLGRGFRGTGC